MVAAFSTRSCRFGPLVVDYDERVLSPRPWTLAQSEWAAELAPYAAPGPLLELCAGAGQIGLAAAVLADRDLVQVEADPVAAGFASGNAARAGRAARVEVRNEPLQRALRPGESFPIIIADPPYLPSGELPRWPEDPRLAIDGGQDGMDLVGDCVEVAARHLAAGGWLLLQLAGPPQAARVSSILADAPAIGLRRRELRVIDDERAILLISR